MTQNDRPITGSLKERDGMYTAILNIYDETGKRKQKYHALHIPVKGNKRKAQAALDELIRNYESPELMHISATLEHRIRRIRTPKRKHLNTKTADLNTMPGRLPREVVGIKLSL